MRKVKEIIKKLLVVFLVNLIIICTASNPLFQHVSFAASDTVAGYEVDLDSITNTFEYEGNPKEMGYEAENRGLKWIFKLALNFVDYLVGCLFTVVKIGIVGTIENIEKLIDNALIALEGNEEEDIDYNDDDVEGDYVHYTIEDLIYNRIPALDVDLLSSKAAGKVVEKGSAIDVIKSTVAGWYVSIRNIAIIIMIIMLIYTGIRMATSTISSKKADYQKQLYTWLKCMVMIFVIHYIIVLVLSLNNIMCDLFEADYTKENTLYNTVKTRAYDFRLSVGFAGTIMYVALFIYWLKFLVVYLKRYVKNLILILLAPLVIVRYALDNAEARGKQGFNKWLNSFVLNVLIQSVHALTYSVIMGIAVDLAVKSIFGFILALVFMSYLLRFDDVIFQIFQFNGSSGDQMLRPMKKPLKNEFASIYGKIIVYKEFGQNIGREGIRAGKFVGGIAKDTAGMLKMKDEQHYQQNGSSIGHTVGGIYGNAKGKVKDAANFVGDKTRINKLIAHEKRVIGEVASDVAPEFLQLQELKRNARRGGIIGENSKKVLKKYKKQQKKRYTTEKNNALKIASALTTSALVLPMMGVDPEKALDMWALSPKTPGDFKRLFTDSQKAEEKLNKKDAKIRDAIAKVNEDNRELDSMINEANTLSSEIQESIFKMTNGQKVEESIEELERIEKLNANSMAIQETLKNGIKDSAKYKNIDSLVSSSIANIDQSKLLTQNAKERLAKIEAQQIKDAQEKYLKEAKDQEERRRYISKEGVKYFNTEEVANKFSQSIVQSQVSEENVTMANKINQMKNLNYKSRKAGNGDIINVNKFIQDLKK